MAMPTEPLWCDHEYEHRMPLPANVCGHNPCCYACCFVLCGCRDPIKATESMRPLLRGILKGSQPLPPHEMQHLIQALQGHWKIQSLTSTMTYETVFVSNTSVVVEGGLHMGGTSNKRGLRMNPKMTWELDATRVLKSPKGDIYFDFYGSSFTSLDFQNGRIEITDNLGKTLLWLREGASGAGAAAMPQALLAAPAMHGMPPDLPGAVPNQIEMQTVGGTGGLPLMGGGNKFCPQCGHEVGGAKFCGNCGAQQF